MTSLNRTFILSLFFLFCFSAAYPEDAATTEQIVRTKEVWEWNIPAFKQYDVPEEYQNESAVILARHRQIDIAGRVSSALELAFKNRLTTAGTLYCSDIERSMIKINDQTALDHFSDFSFKGETHRKEYKYSDLLRTFIGVRIIKPNGEIIFVDAKENTVTITEGKKEEEAYKKLAVPNLQIGDILDYFIYDIYVLESMNIENQHIHFFSVDYPALFFSAYCKIGKNLTFEYRSINNAPEFSREQNESGDIILKVQTNDILRIKRDEKSNANWLSSYRSLPILRFSILQNSANSIYKPASARAKGVYRNVAAENIINDAIGFLAPLKFQLNLQKKEINKILTKFKQSNPAANNDELAIFIAALYNFYWRTEPKYYFNTGTYAIGLHQLLEENGIECKLGFVTNHFGARGEELFDSDDLSLLVTANYEKQLFGPWNRYCVSGEISTCFEGEKATTLSVSEYVFPNLIDKPSTIKGNKGKIIIPTTTCEQNRCFTQTDVSFSDKEPTRLKLKRISNWTGEIKREIQPYILQYVDWDNAMREYLGIETGIIQELNQKRSTRKYAEEVQATLDKQKEGMEERMKNEILSHHGFEPQSIIAYEIKTPGVTPSNPLLEYEIEYMVDGLVKTAGDNFILDIGKLIGQQLRPTDNDRERNIDAYIPSRKMYENEITVTIPDNYKIELTESFDSKTENQYGLFEAMLSVDNNRIKIKTKKIYKEAFIPRDNFPQMLEMLDETNNFYSKSLVLVKKEE